MKSIILFIGEVSLGPLDGIWTSDGDNIFSIEGNTITWHNGETSDISWNEDYTEVELSMDEEKYHGSSNGMEIVWDDEERWNKVAYHSLKMKVPRASELKFRINF